MKEFKCRKPLKLEGRLNELRSTDSRTSDNRFSHRISTPLRSERSHPSTMVRSAFVVILAKGIPRRDELSLSLKGAEITST